MKLAGLLLSLAFIVLLVWLMLPKRETTPPGGAPAAATLGAAPPSDMARSPRAAEDHTRRQVCLAECATEHRTCRTLAAEPVAEGACDEKKAACEGRCP